MAAHWRQILAGTLKGIPHPLHICLLQHSKGSDVLMTSGVRLGALVLLLQLWILRCRAGVEAH